MSTAVQRRRGTTAQHASFAGLEGELTVDTTKDTLVVHDGATTGGRPLLREDQSNLPTSAPTTGIYNASGSLAISTNGTGRLFVNSSGNIGVGTTTPGYTLDVQSAINIKKDGSSLATQYFDGTATRIRYSDSTGNLSFFTNSTERCYVGYNGGVFVNSGGLNVSGGDIVVSGGNRSIINNDNNALIFGTNATERARIDSSGRLLVGTSTARANFFNTTVSAAFQIEGTSTGVTSSDRIAAIISSASLGNSGASLVLAHQTSGTIGGNTAVASDDHFGGIYFQGSDGTDFAIGAEISAFVDGTPGANDMPGRLVFSTTADGASSPTERMRIKNNGTINFSNVAVYADNAAATTGGLAVGDVYRTSTGQLMIRY